MKKAKKKLAHSEKHAEKIFQVFDTSLPDVLPFIPENRVNLKVVCIRAQTQVEQSTSSLLFIPQIGRKDLKNIIQKYRNIKVLVLDHISWLYDDALLHIVTSFAPSLQMLSIAYCFNISREGMSKLPPIPHVVVNGCWKLLSPSPDISAFRIVEAQLCALRADEGTTSILGFYKFHDKFCMEYGRMQDKLIKEYTSLNLHSSLRPLIRAKSFKVHFIGMTTSKAVFAVHVVTKNNFRRNYMWVLKLVDTTHKPMWATNQIREISSSNFQLLRHKFRFFKMV